MPSPCFPPTVCDKVPSFPLTGSLGSVRPLHWYFEDTPTSVARLAGSLRSPHDTCVTPGYLLPPLAGALAEGRGPLVSATPLPILLTQETTDLPGSWGTLLTVRLGLGPRWDRHARPITRVGAVPACVNNEDSRRENFRGSMSRLSVWLSTLRNGGRPPPRKTRFRLPASSTGRDSDPQGSNERFPSCSRYISFPSPRLCLAQ